MSFALPTELVCLARAFAEAGVRLYGVGGMVRNPLLGLPVSDMDITSDLRPEGVMALCRDKGLACVPKGLAFGMVEIHAGACVFEHTTFRADTYGPGGGHRPTAVAFSDTVEADAFRRDFTVNALYQDILGGAILDPTGGLADLKAGLLRATGPEPGRIMGEDALRVLRLARFSAELGFAPEGNTLASAKAHAAGLRDISAERVREELRRVLLSPEKYGRAGAVYRGLSLLDALGALDVVLPELTKGRGVPQRAQYHAYDVLGHCLHAADCASADCAPADCAPAGCASADCAPAGCASAGCAPADCAPDGALALRLAALLHDVGKPVALAQYGRMLQHDKLGAPIAAAALTRLRYPNALVEEVRAMVAGHMFDLDGRAKEGTLRRKFVEWGYGFSRQMARLRRADVLGSGRNGSVATADRWEAVLAAMKAEGAPFTEAELAISGRELMEALGLPPGPAVGRIKRALLMHCAKKPQDNTPRRLVRLARDIGAREAGGLDMKPPPS